MENDTNRRRRKPVRRDLSNWVVTDDWPERAPVNAAEIAVFEAWFGDVFDEMFLIPRATYFRISAALFLREAELKANRLVAERTVRNDREPSA